MKNLITAGLLTLSLLACKDREPDPDVLPAATQTGANTAGCLVDGKVWVASKKYLNRIGNAGTYAEYADNRTRLQIDLRGITNNSNIFLFLNKENFEVNKEYSLPMDVDYNNKTSASYGINGDPFFMRKY